MEDIFVNTSQGRIHLLTAGQGRPLLLLHSNGGSAYEFEHVIDPLAEHFQVFAWDMPGQGDSDPLLRHLSVQQYADVAVEVMDALALQTAIVGGASIGGAVCVALGAHHAARFEKIFVVECPFRTPQEWERVAPRLRNVTDELMVRWNIDRAKAGSKTCLSVMWALREYDIAADLAKFPAGQVLVFGDKSPTVAKAGQFEAALTDATTHIISDCGHFPMIDDPERFVDIFITESQAPHAS